MKAVLLTYISLFMTTSTLFDFTTNCVLKNWSVVDDVVMGGRSQGYFELDQNGHGKFSGEVSLENNGGFSSVRYTFDKKDITNYSKVILRVKGDGKTYQFRVKRSNKDRYSYIYEFDTTTEWMTIEIPFNAMRPSYRGRALDLPNYAGKQMEELAFLIGNKKAQSFELLIDHIGLE